MLALGTESVRPGSAHGDPDLGDLQKDTRRDRGEERESNTEQRERNTKQQENWTQ